MAAPAASVQVAVRVRPLNDREKKGNTLPVVNTSSDKKEVTLIRGAGNRQQRQTYSFDAVFSEFSTQRNVFETVRPLVDDVLAGYEATVRRHPALVCARRPRMRRAAALGRRAGAVVTAGRCGFT